MDSKYITRWVYLSSVSFNLLCARLTLGIVVEFPENYSLGRKLFLFFFARNLCVKDFKNIFKLPTMLEMMKRKMSSGCNDLMELYTHKGICISMMHCLNLLVPHIDWIWSSLFFLWWRDLNSKWPIKYFWASFC